MGATPTQVVLRVVLPTALPGISTGVMLAVARAAGETAPLLFTALFSDYWISRSAPEFLPKTIGDLMKPTASLAVLIYNFSGSPFDNQIELAWAAALVLVVIVLIVNIGGQCAGAAIRLNPRRRTWPPTKSSGNGSGTRTDGHANGNGSTRPGDRLQDRRALLRQVQGRARRRRPDREGHHHGVHRPVGLRQEHGAALPEPHERPGARLPLQGPACTSAARTSTTRTVDPVAVRRHIGMVFQQPNPFAMSIYRNVAFGLRLNRYKGNVRGEGRAGAAQRGAVGRGEGQAARRAACRCRAASSSGCASRARSPPSPTVLLMDEPCSALDPIATRRIEELMQELKQQATRSRS